MALLLVAITFLAYLPAIRGQFIWDDDSWTTKIVGLLRDASGLRLLWTNPTALQQYYPLTSTTFWLDYQLWGFLALPYHVGNVFLHPLAAQRALELAVTNTHTARTRVFQARIGIYRSGLPFRDPALAVKE